MRTVPGLGFPAPLVRAFYSTSRRATPEEIQRVAAALTDALEATSYISDSAQQAYLETDPAHRGLPESYTLRYLSFARDQMDNALRQYEDLSSRLGTNKLDKTACLDKFQLTHADALLARDQLTAQIRADEERLHTKKTEGLSRKDLTFCD